MTGASCTVALEGVWRVYSARRSIAHCEWWGRAKTNYEEIRGAKVGVAKVHDNKWVVAVRWCNVSWAKQDDSVADNE